MVFLSQAAVASLHVEGLGSFKPAHHDPGPPYSHALPRPGPRLFGPDHKSSLAFSCFCRSLG